MKKPTAINVEALRANEKVSEGPFAFVIHIHTPNPPPDRWLDQVLADWQKEWGAAPAYVRNNMLVAVHFTASQQLSFVHSDPAQAKPAPGMIIYGTVPWEPEVSSQRLCILGALLLRTFKQPVVEILFQARVMLGKN